MTELSRRSFLASAAAAVASAQPSRSCLLLTETDAARLRDFAKKNRAAAVRQLADAALNAGPWSVTFHRPVGLDIGAAPNDYISEAPYHWPDPRNPSGPYIRRDGEHNPARFHANVDDLRAMCSAVLSLGMGAWILGDRSCGPHA